MTALIRRVSRNLLDTDVLGLSAEMAYYFFFSLFPLFLFALPFFSIVGDKRAVADSILNDLARVVPGDASHLVGQVVNDVVFGKDAPGLMSVGAVFALWAGRNVISALMEAFNQAFGVRETRPWWKRTLIACAFVIGATIVGIAAMAVLLDGPAIVAGAAALIGLGDTGRAIWNVVQYPIVIALVVALACAIYRVLPNLRLSGREVLLGGVLATVLWIALTFAFRVYVEHFGSYNKTYGAIGAVAILLLWMYFTMLAVLSAGVVAAELHRERSGRRELTGIGTRS